MRIAHLSDLHIDSQADVIYGVNPIDNLERAVSMLEKIQDIDAGIITGDISNDGEDDSLMKALVSKNAVSQHYIQYKSALSCIIIKIKIAESR